MAGQGFRKRQLGREGCLVMVSRRVLPQPLREHGSFKRLPKLRQINVETQLRALEEVAVEIDAWFSCSETEQARLGIGVFFSNLEVHIEVAREHKHMDAAGENFSWWIFRDSWYPDDFRGRSFDKILPESVRQRLNEEVPRVGDNLETYMSWLKRQGDYLSASFDEFYGAQDFGTVYIQVCAIFCYLSALYLGLLRAKLSGHYGVPD